MTAPTVAALNRQFGIPGQLEFETGAGGLPFACLSNPSASARICLLGATVVEYQPVGTGPVLWASRLSKYKTGASIRGGIPVCWPWFAFHPNPALPPHGFAYGRLWEVAGAAGAESGQTRIEFRLASSPATRRLWEAEFELRLAVSVGRSLEVSLTMENPGRLAWEVSCALHNFFAISGLGQIEITGLEQAGYTSKTSAGQRDCLPGPFEFGPEVNRIYPDTPGCAVINDPGWRRRIWVSQAGSRSTVVWNPGAQRAQADFSDMDGPEYLKMVCVEPAILPQDHFSLAPGARHTLSEQIEIEIESKDPS